MHLQNAAAKALGEANDLSGALDVAEKELAGAASKLDGLQKRFEAEWPPLVAMAVDLLGEVRHLHDELDDAAGRRVGELAELRGRADAARREMDDATAATRAGLEGFTARAWELEPELVETVELVVKASDGVKARASEVQQSLRQTTQAVADLLSGEIAGDLERMQADLERRIRGLEVFVTSGCLPKLHERASAFQSKLGAWETSLQQKLAELGDRVEGAAREATAKCLAEHREVLERLARIGARAIEVTERLRATVEQGTTAIGEAGSAIDSNVESASAHLEAATETLDDLMRLFRSYSFIPL